jgi:excisionase family DNA binding protein
MKPLTVRQADEALGISPGLVYQLCARRRLRHERHGLGRGRILIPLDALEEYRRNCTVEVKVEAPAVVSPAPRPRPVLRHLRLH